MHALDAKPETQDGKPIDLPYADPAGGRDRHDHTAAAVNESRIYDFYERQAAWYLDHPPEPGEVLPAFPGLDGGRWGHSGRFSQNSHQDDSWAQMDVGDVVACTLRGAGKVVPKALTFQLGTDEEPVTFVFNPGTLAFESYWRGRVRFGDRRWGIVENVYAGDDVQPLDFTPRQGEFLGYFLAGGARFIHYRLDGGERIEEVTMREDGGTPGVRRRPVTMEEVRAAIDGAKPEWTWTFTAAGERGPDDRPYTIDTIPVPLENPYRALMFLAGHDFFSDGDAAVSTIMGDVWIVKGIDAGLREVTWRRFAAGLNQPLGLVIVDDVVHVLCKDRILRLHDLNDDGEADHFENFCDYPTSIGGHDYATDLQRDAAGNFYFSTKHIGTVKVPPDGKSFETLATGIRNPNGIGVRRDGMVVTAPQEGTWTPASMILESRDGRFFGLGAKRGRTIDPPLCFVPRGVDNSTGGLVFADHRSGWGPLAGQLLAMSYGNSTHYAVLVDESTGVKQGAAVPLRGDFLAAPNRARFSPHDGQLYVTGSEGWG
ncbi:MAG: heme-binding domain-containing protein, partial [Akkermansiaceae bacterium]|nr:heme-binding domain-containing protein [Akkermansiaceae bacterium]